MHLLISAVPMQQLILATLQAQYSIYHCNLAHYLKLQHCTCWFKGALGLDCIFFCLVVAYCLAHEPQLSTNMSWSVADASLYHMFVLGRCERGGMSWLAWRPWTWASPYARRCWIL